eukprot:442502_1
MAIMDRARSPSYSNTMAYIMGVAFKGIVLVVLFVAVSMILPLIRSYGQFGKENDPMICPPPGLGDIFQRRLGQKFIEKILYPFGDRCVNHKAVDINVPFSDWKEATCPISCAKGSTMNVYTDARDALRPVDLRCVYDPTNLDARPYWVLGIRASNHTRSYVGSYMSGIIPSSQVFPRDFHSGANGDANSLFCVDDKTGEPVANTLCELASLKSSIPDWESVSLTTPEFMVHGEAVTVECAEGSHVANDPGVRAYQIQCDQGEWRVPDGSVHSTCVLSDAGKEKFKDLGSGSYSSKPGVLTFLAIIFGAFLLALAL